MFSQRIINKFYYLSFATTLSIVLILSLLGGISSLKCPFFELFHVCCPMCGTTRAWKSFLFLQNPWLAFRYNPMFMLWGFWCSIAYMDLWLKGFTSQRPTFGEKLMLKLSHSKVPQTIHVILSVLAFVYLNHPCVREWRQIMDNIYGWK